MLRACMAGIACLLLSTTAGAGTDKLSEFFKGLTTLTADFNQTVVTTGDEPPFFSSGIFYLNRPNRFRWVYTRPEGLYVVADGDRVWLYDPDLEQVSHQSQEEALRGTPALLLSDDAPVEKHFEVVDLGMRNGMDWLELIPRTENSEVIKVLVAFKGEHLDRMEMVDNFGQVTRFLFSNVLRNPDLPQELFKFDPPPEVDILGQ